MTSRDSLRICLTTLVLGSYTLAVTPTVCEGVEKRAEAMRGGLSSELSQGLGFPTGPPRIG